MVSLVDSKAEFKSRAEDLLGSDPFKNLVKENVESFAALAFSVADQPNHIDDSKLEDLAKKIFPAPGPTLGHAGALRRLAFEGLAFSLQDLKDRGDPEASSKKYLPSHEREHKRKEQVARLTGVLLEGDLEPSNGLVDRAAAMLHDGLVRYIPPSACVSRDAEVAAVRRDKEFFAIENGELTLKKKDNVFNADVATDFKLQQAFTRRGVALDRVGLVSFNVHERLVRNYFFLASRAAPPGYAKPGVGAIIKADKELWTLLSRECRDGCKPNAAGVAPLDALIAAKQNDTCVTFSLFPLPQADGRGREWTKGRGAGKGGKGRDPKGSGRSRTPKGRGRGRGKGKLSAPTLPTEKKPPMPKELRPFQPHDDHGRRYCYGFNLEEGCDLPASGKPPECDRGLHVCMSCGSKDHGAGNCPANKKRE